MLSTPPSGANIAVGMLCCVIVFDHNNLAVHMSCEIKLGVLLFCYVVAVIWCNVSHMLCFVTSAHGNYAMLL